MRAHACVFVFVRLPHRLLWLRAQARVESDLELLDDDIAEEICSLEADSYHSDADEFELEADSDKSNTNWVRQLP